MLTACAEDPQASNDRRINDRLVTHMAPCGRYLLNYESHHHPGREMLGDVTV